MKKLCLVISLLFGTTILHGCASTSSESQKWSIEPIQKIRHATNRPDGYYRLGRYYQGQNRFDSAVEAYQKALVIDSSFIEAHNGLGTIYATQGKYEQALTEFNAAISMAPDAAHIHNNLGYLHFLSGDYTQAVAAFTKATTLDPSNQKAWNNLGMALAKNGEPMKSNQAFAQAITNTTSVQSRADNDSNQVAPGNEVYKTAATSIAPKDRGAIVYTSTNKTESNVVEHSGADNMSEAKTASPVNPTQPTFQPYFAVLAYPNPKAMPVVMIDDIPLPASNYGVKLEPKTLKEKPSIVTTSTLQPSSAANIMVAEKTDSKAQLTMILPKIIQLKNVPQKVSPLQAIQPAQITGKRNFVFEISNGNGIKKLAARFGSMLSNKGFPQANFSDHKPYNQAHTVIHYRKGYLFEAARLSRHLRDIQHLAFIIENNNLPPNIDVKLILGKDLSGKFKPINKSGPITLASL